MQPKVVGPGVPPDPRRAAYRTVSTSLALHSDQALHDLVDAAAPLGSGIGERSALLEVADKPVFVKQVPLTEVELRPDHVRSTANVFGLPTFCQYGIGGPGFGAWRELTAHTMTTDWVLAGQYQGFPLMYHWRVLPDVAPALPKELADVERAVAYWGGAPEVRHCIEALRRSPASLVLFLDYLPRTLHQWFGEQVGAGAEATDRACSLVEGELPAGTSFRNDRGLVHFDAHFENILTDGRRLYFADFGLALSSRFHLSPPEAGFFRTHRTYDRAYHAQLPGELADHGPVRVRQAGTGGPHARLRGRRRPPAGPPGATAALTRHAPLAAVVTDFYGRLQHESRKIPYPLREIRRLLGSPHG